MPLPSGIDKGAFLFWDIGKASNKANPDFKVISYISNYQTDLATVLSKLNSLPYRETYSDSSPMKNFRAGKQTSQFGTNPRSIPNETAPKNPFASMGPTGARFEFFISPAGNLSADGAVVGIATVSDGEPTSKDGSFANASAARMLPVYHLANVEIFGGMSAVPKGSVATLHYVATLGGAPVWKTGGGGA